MDGVRGGRRERFVEREGGSSNVVIDEMLWSWTRICFSAGLRRPKTVLDLAGYLRPSPPNRVEAGHSPKRSAAVTTRADEGVLWWGTLTGLDEVLMVAEEKPA